MSFQSSEGSIFASAVLPVIKGAIGYVKQTLNSTPSSVASSATVYTPLNTFLYPAGVYQFNADCRLEYTVGDISDCELRLLSGTGAYQCSVYNEWDIKNIGMSVSCVFVSDGVVPFTLSTRAQTADTSNFTIVKFQISAVRVA